MRFLSNPPGPLRGRAGGATFQHNVRLSLATSNDQGARSSVDYGNFSGFPYFNGRFYFSAANHSNANRDKPGRTLKAFVLVIAPTAVK